jgi:GNAT superfamily N-acetyltransferase
MPESLRPAASDVIRIVPVDPDEHGATFLGFYARSREDATPHPRAVLAEGEGSLWLAYEGERPVGGILTREQRSSDGERRGFIENVIVERSERGRGLGRLLLETVEAHFRARGVFGMQTGGNPANPVSIPLYKRLGFRVVRRYTRVRDGVEEPRILMWKDF